MALRAKDRERPRVVVADTTYARKQPVSDVLEERGYRVVSRPTGLHVLEEVAEHMPDVVILDDEFVDDRPPNTIASIRAVSPLTKVIVLTDHGTMADLGADGYVIKEIPANGNITGPIAKLLEERTAAPVPRPRRKRTGRTVIWGRDARSWLRVAAVAVAFVAALWAASDLLKNPVQIRTHGAPIHEHQGGKTSTEVQGSPLDLAFGDLKDLDSSLRDGSYHSAMAAAASLMEHRAQAESVGLPVSHLDRLVTRTLKPLVGNLPARVLSSLRGILGRLMPAIPRPQSPVASVPSSSAGGATVQAGGSTVVVDGGSGGGSGGGGGGSGGGGSGGGGGGGDTGGGGSGGGGGGGGSGGGGGGGGSGGGGDTGGPPGDPPGGDTGDGNGGGNGGGGGHGGGPPADPPGGGGGHGGGPPADPPGGGNGGGPPADPPGGGNGGGPPADPPGGGNGGGPPADQPGGGESGGGGDATSIGEGADTQPDGPPAKSTVLG